VSASNVANVTQQDNTDLLHLSPDCDEQSLQQFLTPDITTDHEYCRVNELSLLVIHVVEYIAGWVVRNLSPMIACDDCRSCLVDAADTKKNSSSLLEIKNNGGLVRPSAGVVTVLSNAEKVLRECLNIHRVDKRDNWDHSLET